MMIAVFSSFMDLHLRLAEFMILGMWTYRVSVLFLKTFWCFVEGTSFLSFLVPAFFSSWQGQARTTKEWMGREFAEHQKRTQFAMNDVVTGACRIGQTSRVSDGQVPALIMDQSLFLKRSSGNCDDGANRPEYF